MAKTKINFFDVYDMAKVIIIIFVEIIALKQLFISKFS